MTERNDSQTEAQLNSLVTYRRSDMPSLPDLPAKNPSLIDATATNALYSKATREYINRNFSDALATIKTLEQQQSLTLKTKKRVFLLYLAVLDAVAKLDDAELHRALGHEGTGVADRLRLGTVWNDSEVLFDRSVPLDISVHIIMTLSRHTNAPAKLQEQVEALLTSLDPDSPEHDSISELYALHVLPRGQEWESARSFIEEGDMSTAKRDKWIETLGQIRVAQDEQKNRQAQEAEEARRAEQEAKKLKKIRKNRANGSKKSATSVNGSTAGSTILPGSSSPQAKSNEAGDTDIVAVSPSTINKTTGGVLERWSRSLMSMHYNSRVLKVLIFLALLFGATGRRAIRERIQRGLVQAGRTIGMAFKVSYI